MIKGNKSKGMLLVGFFKYSSLPNRRVAWNKHGGGKDEPFLIKSNKNKNKMN